MRPWEGGCEGGGGEGCERGGVEGGVEVSKGSTVSSLGGMVSVSIDVLSSGGSCG